MSEGRAQARGKAPERAHPEVGAGTAAIQRRARVCFVSGPDYEDAILAAARHKVVAQYGDDDERHHAEFAADLHGHVRKFRGEVLARAQDDDEIRRAT